jgi:Xaa-Pro aminopeptidase
MSYIDRQRARRLMETAGLDALVLFGPEAFTYATGMAPGVAAMWRRAGGAIALVPADPSAPITAVVGDLNAAAMRQKASDLDIREHRIWVDTVDLTGLPTEGRSVAELIADGYRRQQVTSGTGPRPSTFEFAEALQQLREALVARGLTHARIGADWDFLPVADHHALVGILPEPAWSDGSDVLRRLRAVKTPGEIERLRRACALAEAGLRRMAGAIVNGASRQDLSVAWRAGVAEAAAELVATGLTGTWNYIAVGPDPWAPNGVVAPGALIKADVGCLIDGYSSDGARSYVFGRPAPCARELFKVISAAFHAGLDRIRPGALMADVHMAVAGAMQTAGYPDYHRGHFGHGLGASVGSEEWPFIAADSAVEIETGMVLAFEVPFYARALGAIMIEDQLLVTATGIEAMNTLPRDLAEIY